MDPAGFPAKALREAAADVLAEDWRGGLQYGEAGSPDTPLPEAPPWPGRPARPGAAVRHTVGPREARE